MRLFILKLLLSLPFFIAIPVNSSDPSESELEQGASSSSKRSRKEFEESATPQVGNKHPIKSYIEEYEEREAKGMRIGNSGTSTLIHSRQIELLSLIKNVTMLLGDYSIMQSL